MASGPGADSLSEKLKMYEEQLATVDAALAHDPSNDELIKLKADLVEVIRLTRQVNEAGSEPPSSTTLAASTLAATAAELKSYSVGEKCQAVYEQDGMWHNAKVVALSADGYFVTYLGYGNTAQVDFAEVRPYVRPDTSGWHKGTEVYAIAAADQRWYPAKLLQVEEERAMLRFHGEADVVEVELDSVRLAAAAAPSTSSAAASSGQAAGGASTSAAAAAAPKVPKGLEILPTDSSEEVARKKRKANMVKRHEKREREEQHGDDRRASWQNFSKKNRAVQRAKNGHDPNWDPTRDHGETKDRIAMDKFHTFAARQNQ